MKRLHHRVIMHLDLDSFFVSAELLTRPELRGQKIIVARESPRSVVLSASYEARAYGVRSAMPLARAKQLCPQALVLEPSAPYHRYSQAVMDILREITDRVEQVSIDEAFVDLTATLRRLGDPVATAQRVRHQIFQELSLPASVGIASTKFIAKMASAGSKPNGLWVIPPDRVQNFLDPLPVAKLWGVGPKTAATLESWGAHTVAQLREYELAFLQAKVGKAAGEHLYSIARGIDPRPVEVERQEKSIGAEHTFLYDSRAFDEISREVLGLALTVGRRLRAAGKHTKSLSLKIRFSDFETITRACPLENPTDSGQVIHRAVMKRLQQLGLVGQEQVRTIRLIGVRAEKVRYGEAGVQESLLDELLEIPTGTYLQDWHGAEAAMDKIQKKFGSSGLIPANFIKNKPHKI